MQTDADEAVIRNKHGNILCPCRKKKHECKECFPEKYKQHRETTNKTAKSRYQSLKTRTQTGVAAVAAPDTAVAPEIRDRHGNIRCPCNKVKGMCQLHYPEKYKRYREKANASVKARRLLPRPKVAAPASDGPVLRNQFQQILCPCGKRKHRCQLHFPERFKRSCDLVNANNRVTVGTRAATETRDFSATETRDS